MGPDVGGNTAQLLELLLARAGTRAHAVAQLAVDLTDQLVDIALEQSFVGLWPGLLPHTRAGEMLVNLGAEVGREREHERAGAREREAQRVLGD